MATKILKGGARKSKEVFRGKLSKHEIALLAEMFQNGMSAKAIAGRFA